MKKTTTITFKSLSDFRSRITRLWQNQKEDETYEFVFPDEKTEQEFLALSGKFHE
jgi:hypothetical protein